VCVCVCVCLNTYTCIHKYCLHTYIYIYITCIYTHTLRLARRRKQLHSIVRVRGPLRWCRSGFVVGSPEQLEVTTDLQQVEGLHARRNQKKTEKSAPRDISQETGTVTGMSACDNIYVHIYIYIYIYTHTHTHTHTHTYIYACSMRAGVPCIACELLGLYSSWEGAAWVGSKRKACMRAGPTKKT
jgi:hypothetical protein